MHHITHRIPAALAGIASDAIPLPLDHDARQRSRQRLTLDDGSELAIALPASEALNEHDVLVADDGTRFRIVARAEAVLRITSDDAWLLLRAAYHLGNRHTPVAVLRAALLIEPDPVLRDMLLRLGVRIEDARLPFTPDSGAYGGGHRHGHDATFADDHALAQAVFVRHEPNLAGAVPVATPSVHPHD